MRKMSEGILVLAEWLYMSSLCNATMDYAEERRILFWAQFLEFLGEED